MTGTWTVTVTVPAHLDGEALDALFTAVADAAHSWEPARRDGWDVAVTGSPTGVGEGEPAPGAYWERAVLQRFVHGGPVDLATVRQQVGVLLAATPVRDDPLASLSAEERRSWLEDLAATERRDVPEGDTRETARLRAQLAEADDAIRTYHEAAEQEEAATREQRRRADHFAEAAAQLTADLALATERAEGITMNLKKVDKQFEAVNGDLRAEVAMAYMSVAQVSATCALVHAVRELTEEIRKGREAR